jgi:hypothetical protein
MADNPLNVMEEKIVTLVTGNSSWWKQRKYRREAAAALKRIRERGWRYRGKRRLPQQGADTRRFTEYAITLTNGASPSARQWSPPVTG